MWKKIHSNRDPRDTLYSEMRKEFSTYFEQAGGFLRSQLTACPKFYFGLMVAILFFSVVAVFELSRHKQVLPVVIPLNKAEVAAPVADGFSQIMQATSKIKSTLALKQLVDSISAKKHLSRQDSTALDSALTRLQQIH